MSRQRNDARGDAHSILGALATVRIGIVRSYDPKAGAVKVEIMPEEVLTGWLKIKPLAVGPGTGIGIYVGPEVGVQAIILHQEGDRESGICVGFLNDDEEDLWPQDGVPSGEIHALHKSGSFLKFTNDGKVALNSASDLNHTVGGDYNLTVTGKYKAQASEFDLTGDTNQTGAITATKEGTFNSHTVGNHTHIGHASGSATDKPTG